MTSIASLTKMSSQSDDVSQQIREEYRNIQQEIQEKSDADGTACFDLIELRKYVLKANETFISVKTSFDTNEEEETLKRSLLRKKIRESPFDPNNSRTEKLICQYFSNLMMDLNKILRKDLWRFGTAADMLFKRAIGMENMYSALEYEAPQAPLKQSKPRSDNTVSSKKTQPTKVNIDDIETKDESAEVVRVLGILKKTFRENGKKPVEYIRFVVDPDKGTRILYTILNQSLFDLYTIIWSQTARNGNVPLIFSSRSPFGEVNIDDIETKDESAEVVRVLDFLENNIFNNYINNDSCSAQYLHERISSKIKITIRASKRHGTERPIARLSVISIMLQYINHSTARHNNGCSYGD
ncbi:unnamed protein product, partial [Meganyctiphanes norvegica]